MMSGARNPATTFGRLMVFAAVALLALPALAKEDYGREGVYLLAGAAFGFEDADKSALAELDGRYLRSYDAETFFGLAVALGYRFHPHFSVEEHFEWFDDTDVDVTGQPDGEIGMWNLTTNLKGYLSTGRFQPYALIGLGVAEVIADSKHEHGVVTRLGGGLDIQLTESVVLYVSGAYNIMARDIAQLDFGSVDTGFIYRFQ